MKLNTISLNSNYSNGYNGYASFTHNNTTITILLDEEDANRIVTAMSSKLAAKLAKDVNLPTADDIANSAGLRLEHKDA